jgi:translation initiation factor IF-3
LALPQIGKAVLDAVADQLKDVASIERTPLIEGRMMTMILSPLPQTAARAKVTTTAASSS